MNYKYEVLKVSREDFGQFFEISSIFWLKKVNPPTIFSKGGYERGPFRHIKRKLHPSSLCGFGPFFNFWTMGQVTRAQTGVGKSNMSNFTLDIYLSKYVKNASKYVHTFGGSRTNIIEGI